MKVACGLWLAFFGLMGTTYADDLKYISQMVQEQRYPQALSQVELYLMSHRQDARAEFIRGVILARQEKRAEAIAIFSDLTQKHPELPEPYNNLAVLYAEQGLYEKARQMLEKAMKTHPSYNVAYENLGGVYAKMASDAYDKALQVERGTSHPLPRLAMLENMIPNPSAGLVRPLPALKAAQANKPASPVPVLAPPIKPAAPVVAPAPKPVEVKPVAPSGITANSSKVVLEAVEKWAAAWSAKDVKTYLACYADDFKTPNGESRADWAKGRKERINKPVTIKVQVLAPKVKVQDNRATVTFKQSYRAGDVVKRTSKTLHLRQVADKWLIVREEAAK